MDNKNEETEVLEMEETPIEEEKNKKEKVEENKNLKKKKQLIIGIIIIIVLIIAITTILILLLKNNKTNKETKENSNTITITFNSKGGSEVEEIVLEKDKELKLPTTKKEGYVFTGWYNGSTKIEDNTKFDENTTLNAKWEKEDPKSFTIYFDTGTDKKIKPITQECNTPIFLDFDYDDYPKKEYKWFRGWIDKKTGIEYQWGLITGCEDITFEASWDDETIQVYYEKLHAGNDAIYIDTQEYVCGKNMTLKLPESAPKVDGYKFIKWMYEDYTTAKNGDKLTCKSTKIYALYEVDFGEKKPDNKPEPLEENNSAINKSDNNNAIEPETNEE